MAENQSNMNPSSFFNIYRISLTKEQQTSLANLLPRGYSFQPYKCTRSLDEQSLRSQSIKPTKKKHKQLKDPDYAIPYINKPIRQAQSVKVDSAQVIPGGEPFLQCYLILKRLKRSIYSWPFKTPVDPKALGIPQYLNVVLQPMDLKTIEDNLRKQGYAHTGQFHRDMYKILMNSYKFNQKNSEVFATTVEFEEEYLKLAKQAREGKLLQDRKGKIDGSVQEETPTLAKEKVSSVEIPHKPRQYNKKPKPEKTPEEKEKDKEERQKEKQAKQRQKEREVGRVKLEQVERMTQQRQPEQSLPSFSQLFQDFKLKQQEFVQFSEVYEPKEKSVIVKEEQDISVSNQPLKKSKEAKEGKIKEKKIKGETSESLKEIKQLKEVTQVENQKNVVLSSIQRRLSQLLRRLQEFQFNKPKQKIITKSDGCQHPNFNNFSSITASQKKKLAQRISLLPSHELKYIIQICFRNKRDKKRDEDGIYDIDLQKADPKTLKQLSNFVAMRTKHAKRGPKAKSDSSKLAASQVAAEDPYEPDEDEFRYEIEQQSIESGRDHNSGVGELLLHGVDDIHSHMLDQNFNYSVGELMEIDDNCRQSDEYHPDDQNYHF